jgi:propanol-preferring alcohol dehydrogenase
MCSASTAYTSLKESRLRPGQWAVFPGGGGGVGIQGVQLAVAMGLRVVVVDTGEERRELCTRYGAEHFVDFREVEDTAAEVVKLTGGGAHAVFVTGEFSDFDDYWVVLKIWQPFNRIRRLSNILGVELVDR